MFINIHKLYVELCKNGVKQFSVPPLGHARYFSNIPAPAGLQPNKTPNLDHCKTKLVRGVNHHNDALDLTCAEKWSASEASAPLANGAHTTTTATELRMLP